MHIEMRYKLYSYCHIHIEMRYRYIIIYSYCHIHIEMRYRYINYIATATYT